MINLDEIKSKNTINKIESYSGNNPYIKHLKNQLVRGELKVLPYHIDYIKNNYEKEPILLNNVIGVTPFLAEELQKKYQLEIPITKVLVEYYIGDSEKAYHVIGKFYRNQEDSTTFWLPKTQLMDDLFYIKSNVEIDFQKYMDLDKSKRIPYGFQKEGSKFLLERNKCILADDQGLGKAEYIENKVFTPYGRKKIGQLQIGDKVIGSNGKSCTVEGVFPQGIKDLYRVTFNDGFSILVSKEHLFSVMSTNSKTLTLSVEQMLDKDLILSNKNKTYFKNKNGRNKWYIPLVKPILFENQDKFNTDPIEMGKILGDNQDIKHTYIPDEYKYSSINSRVNLLKGLMNIGGNIKSEYRTTSKEFMDDIVEIIHSLGGVVDIVNNDSHSIKFKFPIEIEIDGLDEIVNEKYNVRRYITNIEPEGYGECVCIRVSSKDHLYVSEHGIVTHNTYQTIVSTMESKCERILIVCTASLKLNWKKELLNFVNEEDISVITNKWVPKKYTIINYDILKKFHTVIDGRKKYNEKDIIRDIIKENFDILILDEAHSIKNSTSNRSKILLDIKKNTKFKYIWLLTGTPISNRPINYFNLLRTIDSPLGENWQFYVTRYCNGKQIRLGKTGRKIWITTGHSNLDELNIRTRSSVIRRLKENELDLPDKIRTPIFLELENRKEYNKVFEKYIEWRRENGKSTNIPRKLVELTLLRKFLAIEKTKHTIEMTRDMLDQDKKVIIFTNYKEEMDIIQKEFGKECVTIHGGTSMKYRQKNVDSFQDNDKIKVFIGQVIAAGVGITLTKAEVVIFNSLDWVPGNLEQAEDRAYRISQTKKVNVYYPIFDNTVDMIVWQVLNKKREIINQVMDGSDDSFVEIFKLLENE